MLNSEIKLRPHHCLCIGFFEGKGYSDEFTANMTKVIRFLEKENPVVTLTCGFDEICSCCPNAVSGICGTDDKVQRYDSKLLEFIFASSGDRMLWSDFLSLVRRNIVDEKSVSDVCGDCKWQYICSKK